MVHWKRNIFKLPSGKQGKLFVQEMTRLFQLYAEGSAMEAIALKAAMILPALVLQKPFRESKTKGHIACIERRMIHWNQGNFKMLAQEVRAIQTRMTRTRRKENEEEAVTRKFTDLMMKGKTRAAMHLLNQNETRGSLPLDKLIETESGDKTVREILHQKHPPSQPLNAAEVMFNEEEVEEAHPIIFDEITSSAICKAALHTEGSAGPSGLDATAWRRMCCSFQKVSSEICEALAIIAKKICSTYVDPEPLAALKACRLIALDKCPGVRPIAIGEVPRRIMSKAILSVISKDIQSAVGSNQCCVSQKSGCEASLHAMKDIFDDENTQGVLLADAANAFNNLNRLTALANIRHLCPSIAKVLINIYRVHSNLYINGETIQSSEGTSQGDPLAMPMYALGILPLIRKLEVITKQVWYADDAAAGGSIQKLREWWDKTTAIGPNYGYFVNPSKTWLLVKEEYLAEAKSVFRDTDIQITSTGQKYLGSCVGSNSFKETFVKKKVEQWKDQIERLAQIASSQPHVAYCAFKHGLRNKWTYLIRTTSNIGSLLQPIEDTVRNLFIPALTGRQAISDEERRLFSLPTSLGGLDINIVTDDSELEFENSRAITKPLSKLITEQSGQYSDETREKQEQLTQKARRNRRIRKAKEAEDLFSLVSDVTRRAMEHAKEKGASSWLNTLLLYYYISNYGTRLRSP